MAKKKPKDSVRLTSTVLKAEAMCWLRYGKRMPMVCTEAGSVDWPADVLALSATQATEVEVKISKSDLLADFSNKTAKHHAYKDANERSVSTTWVPNYFYFLVPEELGVEACQIVSKEQPKAGVLMYARHLGRRDGERIAILKQADKLHNAKPSPKMRKAALMRMSSEICRNKLTFAKLDNGEAIIEAQAIPHGIIDCVEPQVELETRGAILAKALHNIEWKDCSAGEKLQLIEMVRALAAARYEEIVYEEDVKQRKVGR